MEFNAWSVLVRLLWAVGLAALVALAIWTLVRAPGKKEGPGLGDDEEPTGRTPRR